MKELFRWLGSVAQQKARRPELFDALLTGQRAAYAWHRLRFFAPRVVLRTLLHALEIGFLSQVLPWEYFAPLLSYRAATALLAGTYWGFLEALRNRVRHDLRRGQAAGARHQVEGWLALSRLLAGAAMLSVLGYITWGPSPGDEPGLNLFDAYGFACVLRFALDLVARTHQAGVAAVRRVYRPFAMSIGPDVLELGFVIAAWERLGPWGFPLGITLFGALRSAITVHYARRTYRTTRMGSPAYVSLARGLRRLSFTELRTGLVHAAANGTAQLDAVLLLALAHAPHTDDTALSFAVLFYVLRPLMGTAQSFTRVFYFDWKRLEAGLGLLFQAAFRRMLLHVSLLIALLVLPLLLAPLPLLASAEMPLGFLWLGPLFVARSLFALEQLEAFSLGQHRRLARLSGAFALTLFILWFTRMGESTLVLVTTLALFGAVAFTAHARTRAAPAPAGPSLPAWLARLGMAQGPQQLGIACVDGRVASTAKVLQSLERELAPWDAVRVGQRHIAWFRAAPATRARVLARAGGALGALTLVELPHGRAALEVDVLEALLAAQTGPQDGPVDDVQTLLATFRAQHPQGHALDFARGTVNVAGARSLPREARRALLRQLSTRTRSKARLAARDAHDVAILFERGAPRLAFVAPRGQVAFASFARRVRRASLTEACRAAGR